MRSSVALRCIQGVPSRFPSASTEYFSTFTRRCAFRKDNFKKRSLEYLYTRMSNGNLKIIIVYLLKFTNL